MSAICRFGQPFQIKIYIGSLEYLIKITKWMTFWSIIPELVIIN
jgi:hypothetical protein